MKPVGTGRDLSLSLNMKQLYHFTRVTYTGQRNRSSLRET